MKLFSFVIWAAWGAIILRVLLAPCWVITVNEGMFLLLVGAPALGVLFWIRWLFARTPSEMRKRPNERVPTASTARF